MERAQISLAEARYDRNLTIEKVAELVDVNPGTVSRWEKGTSIPRPAHLHRLCMILGRTAQELGFSQEEAAMAQNIADHEEEEEEEEESVLASFRKQDLTMRLLHLIWKHISRTAARYHELQALLMLELEGNTAMDDLMSRRDALRRVACLPIELYGLSALYPVVNLPIEELLAHCAAGITACWYLRKGYELTFAFAAVSRYIPTLQEIAKSSPMAQQKAAADLLAQAFLLKATLAREVTIPNDAVAYAQQAENYAGRAENPLLQILALRTQAASQSFAHHWDQALQLAQKAQNHLQTTRVPLSPLVHSYVYAGLATYQAYDGQKQDALRSIKKAHATFFAQSPDEAVPIWIDHNIGNLLANDGQMHMHLGLNKDAIGSLKQIQERYVRDTTISATCRSESFINQVIAEVSRADQPRDMDWCIDRWIQGITRAKKAQSEHKFNESIQAYTALLAAWPGEDRIKKLREHIVRW